MAHEVSELRGEPVMFGSLPAKMDTTHAWLNDLRIERAIDFTEDCPDCPRVERMLLVYFQEQPGSSCFGILATERATARLLRLQWFPLTRVFSQQLEPHIAGMHPAAFAGMLHANNLW